MAVPPLLPLPEPLRLPRGSVRGGIAVTVALTYGYLLLRENMVPTVLINAAVVVVAFYFGTGGMGTIPASTAPDAPRPRRPWIVRGLLLLGFGGLAAWYLRTNFSLGAIPPELLQILEVLGGYVIGLSLSWAIHRRARETPWRRRLATIFRDVSAAGALGLTLYICFAYVAGLTSTLAGYAEELLSLVVTYYFGSRVIGR